MAESSLYLFTHLHKCAGTSLRHHIYKNSPKKERLSVFSNSKICDNYGFEINEFRKISQKFCQNIPIDRQQNLKFIYGHKLISGLEQYLKTDKKPFYFTFLRDPAERMVSLYNYYRGWYERELPNKLDKKIYHRRVLINNQCPDFMTWFENKIMSKEKPIGLCTMIQYYQQFGYLEPGRVTKNKIERCLNKFDLIGFVDSFEQDALYLFHLWKINKFFSKRNISTKYFELKDHPQIQKKLRTVLKDDYLFYKLAKEKKKVWLNRHPEYNPIITEMKEKRQAAWWHQFVFDWPANFHYLSSQLRSWLPLYGKILDKIKVFSAKVVDSF